MPNPLDLPGPQFLAFYAVLAIVVIAAVFLWRRVRTNGIPVPDLSDPYLLAQLRGGQPEALRVAIVSLMDRGLLQQTAEGQVTAASDEAASLARRPIEQTLLHAFRTPGPAWRLLARGASRDVDMCCDALEEDLKDMGLVANAAIRASDWLTVAGALAIVVGTSGLKIHVALERGRHNIGFLVFLTAAVTVVLLCSLAKRRTAVGDRAIAEAKQRFAGLRDRAGTLAPGGATNEVALVAAVFGVAALPAVVFPFVHEVFPRAQSGAATGGCSASGCGGGSGSSDGGSGSGCGGGGGCGGGCGGCGG